MFRHLNVESLPADWTPHFFGDLVFFHMGKTPPRNNKQFWDQGAFPWVSIRDMSPYEIITDTAEKVSLQAHEKIFRRKIVPAGHLLMSFKLTIGRVAKLGVPAYHNEAIISFRPAPEVIDENFLFYYLSQINYANYRDAAVKGMTLNKGKLSALEIACPPPAEQKTIAELLKRVRCAIEKQEKLIALTVELKKALLLHLFTKGAHGGPQRQTALGLIPNDWEIAPLGSLAKVGNGSTPKRDNESYWVGGTIPWLNSTKIHERFINQADQFVTGAAAKECHLPYVKPNSLLIAITGQGKTLGNSALVSFETTINQHLAYAEFTSSYVVPEFVLWFMQTRYEHLRSISQGGGSTKGALTCGFLKTYPIPVPPMNEQQEIAEIFGALDKKERVHQDKHAALNDLFRTLLHQLMTAQIRVDDLKI